MTNYCFAVKYPLFSLLFSEVFENYVQSKGQFENAFEIRDFTIKLGTIL